MSEKKKASPAQIKRIAAKLIEHEHAVQTAQAELKSAESLYQGFSDKEKKLRDQVDSHQNTHLFIPKEQKRFASYLRTQKRLARTSAQVEEAEKAFAAAQVAYDKEKGEKTMRNLQKSRLERDRAIARLAKDTPHAIEESAKTLKRLASKGVSPKVRELSENLLQISRDLALAETARGEAKAKLENAWKAYEKYLQSLKKKQLQS